MYSKTESDMCDVAGCGRPATDNFVQVEPQRVLGFRICDAHAERFRAGERPAVAAEVSRSADRRPVLVMTPVASPEDANGVECGR
ncbi:MAG: hypothetical protein ACXVW7_18720 [Trebonia sp.]